MKHVSPEESLAAVARGQACLLDVRTTAEWEAAHVPGAIHIPLDRLPEALDELDPDAEIHVLCAHGIRSQAATGFLVQQGFTRAANVRSGIVAWPGELVAGK